MGDNRYGSPEKLDHLADLLWTAGDGGAYGELTGVFTRAGQLDASGQVAPLRPLIGWLHETSADLRDRADTLRRDTPDGVSTITTASFGPDLPGDPLGGLDDAFGNVVDGARDIFGDGVREVGETFGDAARGLGDAVDGGLDAIGGLFDNATDAIGEAYEDLYGGISDLTGIGLFEDVGNEIGDVFDDVGDTFSQAMDDVGDAAGDAGDDVGDAADDTADDGGDVVDPDEDDDGLPEEDEGGAEDDPDDVDGDEEWRTPPDEPVGEPKKCKDSWLKRQGVDPEEAKEEAGLRPGGHYDIYRDRDDNLWGVPKGGDPKETGAYLGNLEDYR